jgi:hypothetical protein
MAVITIDELYQGEDKEINFEILEDDEVTPIPLTDYANIVVWFEDAGGTIIQRYSREVLAAHNNADFVIVSNPNGQFKIKMRRAVTLTACLGVMKFEIKVAFTNADYTDNEYQSIAQENIFDVKYSLTGRVTI